MAYEKEIKSALKNKFHANMGLSDSTYEKVANTLGATTTKEEEIETAVSGAEPWLKIVQGEADVILNPGAVIIQTIRILRIRILPTWRL